MGDSLRLRVGRFLLPLPAAVWHRLIQKASSQLRSADRHLTDRHRAVQHFVVKEIPLKGEPVPPEAIASGTGIAEHEVVEILQELERKMTFLWRDSEGRVSWAYPVTADSTPHHVTFSTGERLDAA